MATSTKKLHKDDLYRKASKLLAQKHYDRALKLLEPKVPLLSNDSYFFFLLGWACYHKGDLQGGEIYLKRGVVVNPTDLNIRQLLATTVLRKRDTVQAVKIWLEILDLDPDNQKALWALNQLKEINTSADLARFIISPAMARLVPHLKSGFNPILLLLPVAVACVAGLTVLATQWQGFNFEMRRSSLPPITEPFEDTKNPSLPNQVLFTLTEKEANAILKQADDYFFNHKDNLALRELNRIKYSNASAEQKNKALKWSDALTVPTFTNLDTNFSYRDVSTNPFLYENTYVIWRGLMNNLAITSTQISFNLFVGYQDKTVLEGEVPVILHFETHLEPSLTTEVLGQVKINNDGAIYLVARSIYQIV